MKLYFGNAVTTATTLMILALCTMVVGGAFAIFATDMKKLLAYSSMSQIGFILFQYMYIFAGNNGLLWNDISYCESFNL